MSKKLTYTDFRTASYRNLTVCKHLLENFEECQQSKKKQILHKIYYLSGYIIEFCFKYALFSKLVESSSQNIYEVKDPQFQQRWREHNYCKLSDLCSENKVNFSEDIPYMGKKISDKKINSLLLSWDVQIRYSLNLSKSTVDLKEKEIRELVILTEQILNKVNSRFQ
jgi:hypothetical protein